MALAERPSAIPDFSDKDLPKFTVLVPLYREANMVPSLITHLGRIDYPHDKLDIIFVTEADDKGTNAAVAFNLCAPFSHFKTPPSAPRTKPKALNAAFNSLGPDQRGDIITVYDAEDRPHPLQLRAAAKALMNRSDLVAVQAPLAYYNAGQNWLTRQFDIEYAALFHVWNSALSKLGLIFTLGGTSNHIKRSALEAAGGWDPHNVTEDADLSFRLAALDWRNAQGHAMTPKIGTIGYGTNEEAVANPPDWFKQRSRWHKGFMQTLSVHTRRQRHHPNSAARAPRAIRLRNQLSIFATLIPTLLMSFLHIPSLVMIMCALVFGRLSPGSSALLALTLGAGYGSAILIGIVGYVKSGKSGKALSCFMMPFYWLLQIVPAVIALGEYYKAPSKWRKTKHGRMSVLPVQSDKAPPIALAAE